MHTIIADQQSQAFIKNLCRLQDLITWQVLSALWMLWSSTIKMLRKIMLRSVWLCYSIMKRSDQLQLKELIAIWLLKHAREYCGMLSQLPPKKITLDLSEDLSWFLPIWHMLFILIIQRSINLNITQRSMRELSLRSMQIKDMSQIHAVQLFWEFWQLSLLLQFQFKILLSDKMVFVDLQSAQWSHLKLVWRRLILELLNSQCIVSEKHAVLLISFTINSCSLAF